MSTNIDDVTRRSVDRYWRIVTIVIWSLASAVVIAFVAGNLNFELDAKQRTDAWDRYSPSLIPLGFIGYLIGFLIYYRWYRKVYGTSVYGWCFPTGGVFVFVHYGLYSELQRVKDISEVSTLAGIGEGFDPEQFLLGVFVTLLVMRIATTFAPADYSSYLLRQRKIYSVNCEDRLVGLNRLVDLNFPASALDYVFCGLLIGVLAWLLYSLFT